MLDEQSFKKVVGKLMQQIEEEKRRRVEVIQALTSLPLLKPFTTSIPSDEEIERRIQELL